MTKSDLIEAVAASLKLPKGKAELIINSIFTAMEDALKRGERIEIRGFGSFEVRNYKSYEGRNPRTGIGITDDGHFVFIVVDGRNTGYSKGVTIEESAEIFQELGCTTAYNLDGGGSSTMYLKGEVVNNPSNKNGERATSDILFVG